EIVACQSGLHASEHPFDALLYAPGPRLHKVVLRGELKPHGNPVDKYVGRERKIVATAYALDLLRRFARICALGVIHLWDAPQVVRTYLERGDEKLRAEARNAAFDADRKAREVCLVADRAEWAEAYEARYAMRQAVRAASGDASGTALLYAAR